MRGAKRRLPLVALALLAAVLTPTERAEAQSVPNVFWGVTSYIALESTEDVFAVQASRVSSAGIDVSYTIGGTATCGTDYIIAGANCNARTGTFTLPASSPAFTLVDVVSITFLGDAVSDTGETVILTLTDGADYNLGAGITTTITVVENSGRSAFRLSGRPQVNGVLTGNRVCADPDGEGTLSYEWLWSDDISAPGQRWRQLAGATSQSYTLQQSDLGNYLRLKVRHTDGKGLPGSVYTQIVGPIGPVAFDNTVRFSRDDYNVREGDPLRPTLTFSSPTAKEQTFVIEFNPCDAELPEDINADAYERDQYTGAEHFAAKHSVTVPAGVTRHTFSLPVPLDAEIEDAETFVMGFNVLPAGFTIGDQTDATNQGTQARVQITDVNLVPENWSLKPGAISAGDQFRLLFKTGNERNAQSGDIGVYDTFVRARTSAHPWHADIEAYADTFRVVGSTNTVDAAWHTATGIMVSGQPSHTPFSHPIYWLNGAKIADDYNDFWDGNWDDNAQTKGRHADGLDHTNTRGPNTGTKTGTTHATAGAKATMHLGHSANTRWGGSAANQNPINQGSIPVGNNNVYIGLSGIFLPLDVSAANPLVTIETKRTRVNEGDAIRYTLRAVPAPSSPVMVNVKVTDSSDGGPRFVQSGELGSRTPMIPTSGVATFIVNTHDDQLGETDGEVTVSIGSGSGYRTLAAYDTVMTAVTDDDEPSTLSASVALGNGTGGPARTGANVDFTFSLSQARETSDLHGIRTQMAWSGDVISPRSDNRPSEWKPASWFPDRRRQGAYVRPWLESSIVRGQRSFYLRVHVKNRAEAGGEVGNGWVAMRVAPDGNDRYGVNPAAEWACMPVGNGTCPAAWPGVPTATIVPLDKPTADADDGRVMSGADARYRVTVSPAPGTGETRRVYLKTWEVFINAIDPDKELAKTEISGRGGSVRDPNFRAPRDFKKIEDRREFDPVDNRYKWYRFWLGTPDRNGQRKVQFEDYTHVDVSSSGTADFTMPTKVWRSTENMTGREYLARVQEDVAYSVADSRQAKVNTTIFNTAEAACWYGHRHYSARLTTVGGKQVYSPRGMGITECLTASEIDEWSYGNGSTADRPTVWTSCKPEYSHSNNKHQYTHGGHTHQHHNHDPYIKLGDGSCPGGQSQLDGGDSQDGQTDDPPEDAFPDPGALGFSAVTVSSMTLSWPEREVDHYLVYWAENVADADVQSARVDGDALTYTITGLKPGTEYAVIVYSQDYDEVTPTSYQRTAAAPPADDGEGDGDTGTGTEPQLPDYSALKATIKGYADEQASDSDHARRWNRVLAALGDEDAIAAGHDPMTASEAQGYADRGWSRWDEVVDALTELESRETAEPEPDPIPELSLSAGGAVNEGANASFTVHADPAPASGVTVSVTVSQSGDYLDAPGAGSRTVTLSAGAATARLSVATVNDGADESDGSVSVRIDSGTGYTVASSNATATVTVRDDDDPPPPVRTIGECVSLSQWKTVKGYYDSNSRKSPNYGANWYRVLIAYHEDRSDQTMPDWVGATSKPSSAYTVKEAKQSETVWSGWTPVRKVLECLEEESGQSFAPLLPSSSNSAHEGVVRFVNASPQGGSVNIQATDDSGWSPPPVTLHVGPGESVHLTTRDLEQGNAAKGLSGYLGAATGDWRLDVSSERDIRMLPYVRAYDGVLAPMHAIAEAERGVHRVSTFAPANDPGAPGQTGLLRLINRGGEALAAHIAGTDDTGATSGEVSLAIPAGESVLLTAAELEGGASGLRGALGDGQGMWRLNIASGGDLAVMNLLRSGDGHLTNLSSGASPALRSGEVHTVPYFPSASDPLGRQGLVRIVNDTATDTVVRVQAHDGTGRYYEPLTLALGAGEAAHLNSWDLEIGNASGGLSGRTGSGTGDWRLDIAGPPGVEVLAYVRTLTGVLVPVHDVADASGRTHELPMFNPAGGAVQAGQLRIVNPGPLPARVFIRGRDDGGNPSHDIVVLTVDAGESRVVEAAELETGQAMRGALDGALGDGAGHWRLEVESDRPVLLMNLAESRDGRIVNLSSGTRQAAAGVNR